MPLPVAIGGKEFTLAKGGLEGYAVRMAAAPVARGHEVTVRASGARLARTPAGRLGVLELPSPDADRGRSGTAGRGVCDSSGPLLPSVSPRTTLLNLLLPLNLRRWDEN